MTAKEIEITEALLEGQAWFALDAYRQRPVKAQETELGRNMLQKLNGAIRLLTNPTTPAHSPQIE